MPTDERIPMWKWLFLRRRKPEPTAFVRGDATGSVFRNVYSNAADFVTGNSDDTVFENVEHDTDER